MTRKGDASDSYRARSRCRRYTHQMTTLAQSAGAPVGGIQRVHGREAELTMIDSIAERLNAGEGSLVVWLGEAGITLEAES